MRSSVLTSAAFAAAVAAVAAVVTSACGGGGYSPPAVTPTPTATPPPATTNVTVTIVGSSGNQAFSPNPVMVKTGDTLIFKNSDVTMHHVVLDDGSADLGDIVPGSTKSLIVKGSVATFHCTIHSSMVGSINGTEAPEPPPCTTPGYC